MTSNAPRRRVNPWQLTLLAGSDNGSTRKTIWNSLASSNGSFPTLQELSSAVPETTSDFALSDLTAQIIRNASPNFISPLLNCLVCCYWRSNNGLMDFHQVEMLVAQSGRSVCGYVFKKGDLVWTCRQCSKDPTCVQCDACFKKSNHKGHEVYFHRSEGGSGCCDCGDAEAWAPSGNCSDHNCFHRDDSYDPSTTLPVNLRRGIQAVTKGIVSISTSYATAFVRGLEPLENNEFLAKIASRCPEEKAVASLHNDDIHTYAQVPRNFIHYLSNGIEFDKCNTMRYRL